MMRLAQQRPHRGAGARHYQQQHPSVTALLARTPLQRQLQQQQLRCRARDWATRLAQQLRARPASAAAAAAATSQAAATDEAAAADSVLPSAAQPQDILRAVAADGRELFLEVLQGAAAPSDCSGPPAAAVGDSSEQLLLVAHQGVVYSLSSSSSSSSSSTAAEQAPPDAAAGDRGGLVMTPQRWVLSPQHPLVKALPGWSAALQQYQQQQRHALPTQPLRLQSVAQIYSAAALQAAVQHNPAPWRDGTGPNDPPLRGLQYQTLCAGEVEALLTRQRGVVMVQLWVGWGDSSSAAAGQQQQPQQQPVHNPLVLHSLSRALADRQICIFISRAPEGLGLTAILASKAEPFRAWAAHLASFGAQAALVAESPYYKLLIGRVLGYSQPNIAHHIRVTSGRELAPEVVAAVDRDLRKLSSVVPQLPWRSSDAGAAARAGGNKKAAGGGGGSGGKQQQQQQQQQLPRSARKKKQ